MNRFGLGFASRIDGAELRQQRREAVEIDWGAMSRGVNRGRMAQLELCVDDSFLEDFRRRDWDCIADGKVEKTIVRRMGTSKIFIVFYLWK